MIKGLADEVGRLRNFSSKSSHFAGKYIEYWVKI
mgnify:CR=1 FL=1